MPKTPPLPEPDATSVLAPAELTDAELEIIADDLTTEDA